MRIRITNGHVTHLVMSRSLHVLAIYGFVVVVGDVVVVGAAIAANSIYPTISKYDHEIIVLERFASSVIGGLASWWDFFGCVIAPVTQSFPPPSCVLALL